MAKVFLPYEYYPDPTKGRPVFFGSIFVGVPDLDPEIPANQKPISVIQEDGTQVPVSQPVNTSAGGVPLYNGSPAQIVVDGDYSLKVNDNLGSQVYYAANVFAAGQQNFIFGTIADMVSAPDLSSGSYIKLIGSVNIDDGHNSEWLVQTPAEYGQTPDEYGARTLANGNIAVVQPRQAEDYPCGAFGITPANSDNGVNINAAEVFINGVGGGWLCLQEGGYDYQTPIELLRLVNMRGAGNRATELAYRGVDGPEELNPIATIRYLPQDVTPGTIAQGQIMENLKVLGTGKDYTYGVEIGNVFQYKFRNMEIDGWNGLKSKGLSFNNNISWTEGTVLENVQFDSNLIAWGLRRTGGTNSFTYTRAINVAIDVPANSIGMQIGDDEFSTDAHGLTNSILNVNIWLRGENPQAVQFGADGRIRYGGGIMNGEAENTTSRLINYTQGKTITNGFLYWDGYFKSSPAREDAFTRFKDLRYKKVRDCGNKDPVAQDTARWIKIGEFDDMAKSSFNGHITSQSDYGASGSRTSVASFYFGINGAEGIRPAWSVVGDGFHLDDDDHLKLEMWLDNGVYSLYIYQPSFTETCVFDYNIPERVGSIAVPSNTFLEIWTEVPEPSTGSLVWASYDKAADSQTMYSGNQKVFIGDSGVSTYSAAGGTAFNVPHGLGRVPDSYSVQGVSSDATAEVIDSIVPDATNLVVTYKVAPPSGTNNVLLSWQAFVNYPQN